MSGSGPVEVYNQTNTLKYGTEYSVVGLTSSSVVAVVSAVPFSTPDEPIRITSTDCSLGGDQQKSALVTMTGVKLGGGRTFNVTVRKMEGSTLIGAEIILSGTLSGESSSTTLTHSVLIFGTTNPQLSFGTTYQMTKFGVDESVSVVDTDVTFAVPSEPSRIVRIEKRQMNKDRTQMIVLLEGRALVSRTGKLNVSDGSMIWESLSDVIVVDDTHCTAEFAVGEVETSNQLRFGEEYTLRGSWTESTGFHVEDGITLVVPFPPIIAHIEFIFSNTLHTTCFVKLTGTDLIVGSSLNGTLNDSLSFVAPITSETEALSTEKLIGWPTTLQHNSQYTLTSIDVMNEDDEIPSFDPLISNSTGSLPDDVVIFVGCGSSSESTLFCGDRTRPCSSIEDGWKIVEGVGIGSLSMSIVTLLILRLRILAHIEKSFSLQDMFSKPVLIQQTLSQFSVRNARLHRQARNHPQEEDDTEFLTTMLIDDDIGAESNTLGADDILTNPPVLTQKQLKKYQKWANRQECLHLDDQSSYIVSPSGIHFQVEG
ncbi:hypothetical protein BLNAU_22170 [Blattamonas nauphoetae]|uniref:Uncharacterized protein n=1 Tax=Blattamonas nauphoetae TaxID=2049346 RepID=A0ABQ9WWW5_9EUKA|nr:hypothetical protein BLNAU_22170 [Blattamonas nauphoetae]